MNDLVAESTSNRWNLFLEVAQRSKLDPIIIEKDFWVCWCLKTLFHSTSVGEHLVFKGGTSLSKAYNLIQRFSEDIDLTISKSFLDISPEMMPEVGASRKKQQQFITELQVRASTLVAGKIKNQIETSISGVLKNGWRLEVDPNDSQTLLFHYPQSTNMLEDLPYLTKYVRLEFGVLGDTWPTKKLKIQSYASETLPTIFKNSTFDATVMDVQRTFWEKVTLLHAEHHRPPEKATPLRISRHYYDLFKLANAGIVINDKESTELLNAVVRHKNTFFTASWASYHTATRETVKLLPSTSRMKDIENDYEAMQLMFFEPPPSFEDLMSRLSWLEKEIREEATV